MTSLKEAATASGIEAERRALNAVLRSRTFSKNPRLAALLEYLCHRCFAGQAETIKEFNIATDVFGRPADFDQSQDAIVRVEMHRLRKKLKEFYAEEGREEPIEIVIHSGRYLPEFVTREPAVVEAPQAPASPGPRWVEPSLPLGHSLRYRMWLGAGLTMAVLLATALVFAVLWRGRAADNPSTPAHLKTPELPVAVAPPGDTVRILCGASKSGYRDRQGDIWSADAYYTGGSAVSVPEQPVYRTRDTFLFHSMRAGDFTYKIPLKPGAHEMRLYFADSWYSPGVALEGGENTRVFHVILNGEPLLRDFDIISDSGPNTADVRVFKDVHPDKDGYLHLSFVRNQGAPLINAIEIVPGIPHRLLPIRLVTQDNALTDRAGVTWYPDNYFFNGRTIARSLTVTGAEDPEIYGRERYGNFSYAVPVAEGRYRLTLRFAETYWGPASPGGGGAGTRIFDVYCNGVALLRNFDMLKEAPSRSEIVKSFPHLEPNAQGKLLLSFVPVRNYANVSAIEVFDEADTRE
jgi:hypothetical protein